MSGLSLAILQRVCTPYRVPLFRRLAQAPGIRSRVFIGEDLPGSKVRSAVDLEGLDVVRLPTRWLRLGRRVLPLHRGLHRALTDFAPDVILSEGESHLLGFLTAARLRDRLSGCGLVHWSLGGLPGEHRSRALDALKRPLQARADTLLCYSSHGAAVLEAIGHPREKIVVAVNVCDTEKHLEAAASLEETRTQARAALGIPDRFTVMTVGTLEVNKRIDVLIEAVAGLPEVTTRVVGDGPMRASLASSLRDRDDVALVGAVPPSELPRYYRASDVVVVPGRGGMVISEAMAHGRPVIVHQADGTERDLVVDGKTGLLLREGDAPALRAAIEDLARDPARAERMGANARARVAGELGIQAMVSRILEACQRAREARTATPSS